MRDIEPAAVVFLVHGTWAFGRRKSVVSHFFGKNFPPENELIWSDCPGDQGLTGSNNCRVGEHAAFRRRLSKQLPAGTRIRGFRWTGYNGIHARGKAATKLAEEINAERKNGTRQIFVVAHSHGGNVAHYASTELGADVSGIVALATPFISASKKVQSSQEKRIFEYAGRGLAFLILVLGAFLIRPVLHLALARLAGLGTLSWFKFLSPTDFADEFVVSLLLTGFLLMPVFYILDRSAQLRRLRDWRSKWVSTLTKPPSTTPCLVIRASGDEAHASLMIGQIINWLQQVSFRGFANIGKRLLHLPIHNRVLTVTWAVVVFAIFFGAKDAVEDGYAVLAAHSIGQGHGSTVLLFAAWLPFMASMAIYIGLWVVAIPAIIISRSLTVVGSSMFGVELALLSGSIDLQVEAGPSDREFDGLFFSKNLIGDSVLSFRHGIYNAPVTAHWTAKWIRSQIDGANGDANCPQPSVGKPKTTAKLVC
ncbi:Alpha/beta hydrolase family protein [Caballeronia choica]|uniref:Alpha/beta hydrolase family protein n=1 Tax=Caballeronia choica TaxID=326476 RepID=A0A158KNB3_9BURK|nr:alpha/beta fold hydrolase [Caballeronia choica]SAL82485.1 Alpha/beta hydrolase family protein [Caballeronia choica]